LASSPLKSGWAPINRNGWASICRNTRAPIPRNGGRLHSGIRTRSNGCTEKGDFDFVVRDRGDDEFDVGFRRERQDNCKALVPEGRRMTWSFAELGIPRQARVMILNPVGR